MRPSSSPELVTLEPGHTLWERCFIVAPLIVVGTLESDGKPDLAPKHMAAPLSWEEHFGFVCTSSHATYRNARREGCFTVSFPRPEQIVQISLAAAPRSEDDQKHSLGALETFPARSVKGVLLAGSYLHFECELERVVDGFGSNSLIAGRIVAAHAAAEAVRAPDRDDAELLAAAPVLAYLHPGRFASIADTNAFPFHAGFTR